MQTPSPTTRARIVSFTIDCLLANSIRQTATAESPALTPLPAAVDELKNRVQPIRASESKENLKKRHPSLNIHELFIGLKSLETRWFAIGARVHATSQYGMPARSDSVWIPALPLL